MPAITVIITNYHHEAYLMNAVQSIIDQTFKDWELIIVNDCDSYLHQYQRIDKRIRIIHNIENLGQSASLNIGVSEAEGEFIAFQDADDISFPYRLEVCQREMISKPDFIYGDKVFLCPNGKQKYWKSPDFTADTLINGHLGSWGSYMVRTVVARSCPFPPDIAWGNDHIFLAQLYKQDAIISYIPIPLYKQKTYTSTYLKDKIPLWRKYKRIKREKKISKMVYDIIMQKQPWEGDQLRNEIGA